MTIHLSIHKVADLLGISTDTIRLYEKEGLVAPKRNPANGYRYYEAREIHRIMGIYLYRQMNISIAEIRSAFEVSDFDNMISVFSNLISSREQKIVQLQAETEKLRFMTTHLNDLSKTIFSYSVKELPERYIVFDAPFDLLDYDHMKSVLSSPFFSFGHFCQSHYLNRTVDTPSDTLQFMIDTSMASLLDMDSFEFPIGTCKLLPSENCLYTVIPVKATYPPIVDYQCIIDYADQHYIRHTDRLYIAYVFSLMKDQAVINYFELFLPLSQ